MTSLTQNGQSYQKSLVCWHRSKWAFMSTIWAVVICSIRTSVPFDAEVNRQCTQNLSPFQKSCPFLSTAYIVKCTFFSTFYESCRHILPDKNSDILSTMKSNLEPPLFSWFYLLKAWLLSLFFFMGHVSRCFTYISAAILRKVIQMCHLAVLNTWVVHFAQNDFDYFQIFCRIKKVANDSLEGVFD